MYKKEIFRDLDKKYNSHLYSGLLGIVMNYCHKTLENFKLKNKSFDKILEIGAGSAPHYNYIKHDYNEYHIVDTSDFAKDFHKNNDKVKFLSYDGKVLPYENQTFDRIIISHTLEHIIDFENFLNEMIRVIKKNSVISIASPCDNGFLWRLGRYILKKTYHKLNKTSEIDYNYFMAKEHVNTIFQIISVLKKNFNIQSEIYLPFRIKIIDINLIHICHIIKNKY